MKGSVMIETTSLRVDIHPTHTHGDYQLRPGKPLPFGAMLVPGGVNFSIFSRHATACTLVLFEKGESQPMVEIPYEPRRTYDPHGR